MLAKSYKIVGVELSSLAINDLFAALDLVPEITPVGTVTRYSSKNIDIWVDDIFDLSSSMLGGVDAIYDRAALVALPEHMRNRYAAHLITLTHAAAQLLITYQYDQHLYDGPPFSVPEKELKRHYGGTYQLKQVAQDQIVGASREKWKQQPLHGFFKGISRDCSSYVSIEWLLLYAALTP